MGRQADLFLFLKTRQSEATDCSGAVVAHLEDHLQNDFFFSHSQLMFVGQSAAPQRFVCISEAS